MEKKVKDIKEAKPKNGATKIESKRAPKPVGAYPHARQEGEFLFLSGVGPRSAGAGRFDPFPGVTLSKSGEILDYDIEVQTRSVIRNVQVILEDSGSELGKIVDVQVYLTNMKKDFDVFNRVYAELIGPIGATRTTIEVGSLPAPIAVEFKVIAKI